MDTSKCTLAATRAHCGGHDDHARGVNNAVGVEYRIMGLTYGFWVAVWVMLRADTRW